MRPRRRSNPVFAFLVALAALGVCVGWGVGALASQTRAIAVAAASALLGRDIAIGRVSGTPWSGLAFEEVAIASALPGSPPALTARRITVFFDSEGYRTLSLAAVTEHELLTRTGPPAAAE